MGKYWTYIKYGFVALLLIFIVFDLSDGSLSSAKIETVTKNVAEAAGFSKENLAENRMIKRFYGLNAKDYEGAVLYAPSDNMDVHELFIVKLKDTSQSGDVEKAIKDRLETQLTSFEGYGAEQTALLKKHVLVVKGNYILYAVGEQAGDARKAFLKSI